MGGYVRDQGVRASVGGWVCERSGILGHERAGM